MEGLCLPNFIRAKRIKYRTKNISGPFGIDVYWVECGDEGATGKGGKRVGPKYK